MWKGKISKTSFSRSSQKFQSLTLLKTHWSRLQKPHVPGNTHERQHIIIQLNYTVPLLTWMRLIPSRIQFLVQSGCKETCFHLFLETFLCFKKNILSHSWSTRNVRTIFLILLIFTHLDTGQGLTWQCIN